MRLLRHVDLKSKGIPFSREYLRQLEAQGRFPKRISLTGADRGFIAYDEAEIDAWLAERAAARDRVA